VGISGCKDTELKAEIDRAGLPLLNEGKEKAPRAAPVAVQTPSCGAKRYTRHKNAND
jgi:septum site-determining protein MinC